MQTIKLDIAQNNNVPLLYVKQRDVGYKFLIKFYENGQIYTIDENYTVAVWYSGASGEGNYTHIGDRKACEIEGNKIAVEMIMQMLNEPGDHEMCVVVYDYDNQQQGFWNIPYYVEAIPGADSEGATEYYQAFLDAQKKAEEAADRAEDAADRAEAAGGGAGGGTIIVAIDEGNMATHTALEIYNAIQDNQSVVFRDEPRASPPELIPIRLSTPSKAVFSKPGYPAEFDSFDIEIDDRGTISYNTHFSSTLVNRAFEKVETDIAPLSSLPQTLTEEQKAQARENIGAAAKGAGGDSVAPLIVTLSEDESIASHTSAEIHQAAQNNQDVWLETMPGLYFPLLHRDEYCAVFGTFWDGTSFKTYSVYDDASVEPDEEHFVNEDDISAFQTEEQVLALIQANLPPNGDEVLY